MTPEEGPAASPAAGPGASAAFRVRLVAGCVLLTGLAFVQEPGRLTADTKFDLAVDPATFLARALHLWDPEGALGQLQNQAYGYLWPMGPFFWAGDAVGMPGWAVQRLWLALVLTVAFVGVALLARALGVRSDLACLVAGAAYALSPRMLTVLGPISIEAWPSAMVPWVLLPLVIGSQRGSPRRAAALSALAIAMVGGVNAAATFAVIPLGVLWILTRRGGPRRRRLMVWWPLFTLLGTLWWLVPLFVMGGYSPPFLAFIESSANTTFPTTPFDALRGTSNWVPYVDATSRAGNDLLRESMLIVNSAVLLLLGLAGLMAARTRERVFLALGVGAGLVLVTMGHVGSTAGWGAGDVRTLLDGVLSPLRNVHKLDPVLRLPLALGVGWTVDHLLRDRTTRDADGGRPALSTRTNAVVLAGAAVVAVLGAALPAPAARIPPTGSVQAVPEYWQEAADWLDDEDATALLVPGSSFAEYVWGSPRDEPLQFLDAGRWAVRNAVPLTPPGHIRALDALETHWAQGDGSEGLTAALRRDGVTHLVVRNDLQRAPDVPDPVLVHQAIDATPGLALVASFGPEVGGEAFLETDDDLGRLLVNDGWQNEYPAVEVFALDSPAATVRTAGEPSIVVGGPEDLPDLAELGVLGDQPAELAVDAGSWDAERDLLLTDGFRDVERHFGRVHDGSSATRTPDDPRRMPHPWADYREPDTDGWTTRARYEGAAAVEASSSMSDANAILGVRPGQQPYAAVDDDPLTAWRSNRVDEPGWWQVTFDAPIDLEEVTVAAGPDSREVVRVRTPSGVSEQATIEPGSSRTFELDEQSGSGAAWLRVEDVSGAATSSLALAEVDVPGLTVRRTLVLPTLPEGSGAPRAIVLRAVADARTGCAEVDSAVRCAAERIVPSEEPTGFRRAVTLPEGATYDPTLLVRARPGPGLDALLLQDRLAGIAASTTGVPDPQASALAAVDGDLGTTWIAADADLRPTLTLNWVGKRLVSGLSLDVADDAPARLPTELTLRWPGGRRTVELDDGEVRFPPVRTDVLTLAVDEAEPAVSLDFDSALSSLPVGVGELRLRGVSSYPLVLDRERVELPCGSGPVIEAAGRRLSTAVTASEADLFEGRVLPARVCASSGLVLGARENLVAVEAAEAFVPDTLVLSSSQEPVGPPVTRDVASSLDDPTRRTLLAPGEAAADDRVVWVAENTNAGWEATQDGRLEPVVLDGWQQGWRLVGADAAVTATFAPDGVYRAGLGLGALAFLALVLLTLVPARRWPGSGLPPIGSLRLVAPVAVLVAAGVGGLVVGTWGALLALGAAVVAASAARLAPLTAPWVLASVVVPAAAVYAARPWGSIEGWAGTLAWPHYLVVAVVASVIGASSSAGARPAGSRRWANRMAGRSTRR